MDCKRLLLLFILFLIARPVYANDYSFLPEFYVSILLEAIILGFLVLSVKLKGWLMACAWLPINTLVWVAFFAIMMLMVFGLDWLGCKVNDAASVLILLVVETGVVFVDARIIERLARVAVFKRKNAITLTRSRAIFYSILINTVSALLVPGVYLLGIMAY